MPGSSAWRRTLVALEKRGVFTAEDARNIFSDARVALAHADAFPGDSRAVEFADMALRSAENLLGLVERTAGPYWTIAARCSCPAASRRPGPSRISAKSGRFRLGADMAPRSCWSINNPIRIPHKADFD
jgi:hypothetical protein